MNNNLNLFSFIFFWINCLNYETRNLVLEKITWLSEQDPRIASLFQYIFWWVMKTTTVARKRYDLISNNINEHVIEPLCLFWFENQETRDVLFIKDGKIIDREAYMYVKNSKIKSDMILYEWTMPQESKYDNSIMRFNTISEVSDKFKMSNVSLLAAELVVKTGKDMECKYSIDFKKDNYYIENNILFDQIFIKYWCKEMLRIKLDVNVDYEVSFFDNNMAHHIIKSNQYILIGKDDFEIVTI
jgi:hypothetical protein